MAGSRTAGELGFQFVAYRHQFIHLRHDPVLFGKGWKGDWQYLPFALADDWQGPHAGIREDKFLKIGSLQGERREGGQLFEIWRKAVYLLIAANVPVGDVHFPVGRAFCPRIR